MGNVILSLNDPWDFGNLRDLSADFQSALKNGSFTKRSIATDDADDDAHNIDVVRKNRFHRRIGRLEPNAV